MEKLRHFYIVADYNDGDYGKGIVSITEEQFQRFKPIIEAIRDFEPYIERNEWGGISCENWAGQREDLGDMSIYEKYSQFSEDELDEFNEVFLNIPNPDSEYCNFHTIVKIQEVFMGDILLDYDNMERNYESPKIKAYLAELKEIDNYKRADGLSLNCIPFSEMTPEENALIERRKTLWKKYQ